jgi:1-pyrroline-5-carboxylate dehydrogenase
MNNFNNSIINVPFPENEKVYNYEQGSIERSLLIEAIDDLKSKKIEIPLVIGGKEIKTGKTAKVVCPHNHSHVLAEYHMASKKEIRLAIEESQKAWKKWQNIAWQDRISIFLKAAELLSTKYRYLINAATMLSISKNAYQAEIDSACELIDFLRFNSYYAAEIYKQQPLYSPKGVWNYVLYRPLEGFVFAVTPFNFTAISGNLPTSPAIMGNVVLWKPASSAVYAPYFLMKIFKEAGLPDGVINFVPARGSEIGDTVLKSELFSGVHFTGSTAVFQSMWKTIGENISKYKSYPRIVGETGGKDFIFAHNSADLKKLVTATIRGAYEYQGQKCSAASRLYLPKSIFNEFMNTFESEMKKVKVGDVEDFKNFVNAVIDENAFDTIVSYIEFARGSKDAEILYGGTYDKSKGYFIDPTVILAKDPHFKTMQEEIFGPVLTIYAYEDEKVDEMLDICDKTSMYGLTGAVFANDREFIAKAMKKLEFSAGNFYINDKPTGAVVGQQPFGGSRASGTNDKAGSYLNLLRWVSPRAVKESFNAPDSIEYPFMK